MPDSDLRPVTETQAEECARLHKECAALLDRIATLEAVARRTAAALARGALGRYLKSGEGAHAAGDEARELIELLRCGS